MVEAGLTPWQALAAATTAAGDLLGRGWGLAAGDQGSVLVLDASPLEDIANTRRIHAVVHHGKRVDREPLLPPAAPGDAEPPAVDPAPPSSPPGPTDS